MSDVLSCFRCGADCSLQDHARDKTGRVACMACFNQMRSGGKVRVRGITNAHVLRPKRAPAPPPTKDGPTGDEAFKLDDPGEATGGGAEATLELAPEPVEENRRRCPGCGSLMHETSLQCASCGYEIGVNPALQRLSIDRRAARLCGRCKYDLSGTVGEKCPECGAPVSESITAKRAQTERRLRAQTIRQSMVMIVVGMLFSALMRLGWDSMEGATAIQSLGSYALTFTLCSVAVISAYLLLAKVWFGFSDSTPVLLVEVMSAFVLADVLLNVLWGLKGCYFPYVAWLGVFCWGLVWILEHSGLEASVVGVVVWVLYVALSTAVQVIVF